MSKSMIINVVNEKKSFIPVPTNDTLAAEFATNFLDGEFAVYSLLETTPGADVFAELDDVNVMFKDSTTGGKGYMSMLVEPSVTDEVIFASLVGMTLNSVNIDQAYIISRRKTKKI